MGTLAARLFADDSGQDLIEYALLTSLVGISAIAVFDLLTGSISTTYRTWNTNTNDLWQTPDPVGSP